MGSAPETAGNAATTSTPGTIPQPFAVTGFLIFLCLAMAGLGWGLAKIVPLLMNERVPIDGPESAAYLSLAFLVEMGTFLAVHFRLRYARALGVLSLMAHGLLFGFAAFVCLVLRGLGNHSEAVMLVWLSLLAGALCVCCFFGAVLFLTKPNISAYLKQERPVDRTAPPPA